jgi:hypothetical protein
MAEARERFREKALQTIGRAIHNDDWRAAVAALKLVLNSLGLAPRRLVSTA